MNPRAVSVLSHHQAINAGPGDRRSKVYNILPVFCRMVCTVKYFLRLTAMTNVPNHSFGFSLGTGSKQRLSFSSGFNFARNCINRFRSTSDKITFKSRASHLHHCDANFACVIFTRSWPWHTTLWFPLGKCTHTSTMSCLCQGLRKISYEKQTNRQTDSRKI